MIADVFLKIAGVDGRFLREHDVPPDDRTWIVQLGLALVLSFVVISTEIYYSFDYVIRGFFPEAVHSSLRILSTFAMAAILATMIVMLDRAFILSDWYSDATEAKGFRKIVAGIRRAIKITLRVSISAFLAYTLSEFLVLRLFDAKITQVLQTEHLKLNRPYRAELEKFQKRYDQATLNLQTELRRQKNRLDDLRRSPLSYSGHDARLDELSRRHEAITKEITKLRKYIESVQNDAILAQYRRLEQSIGCIRAKMSLEERSTRPTTMRICGEDYTSSGIPRRGRRYRNLQAQLTALEQQKSQLSVQLDDSNRMLTALTTQLSDAQGKLQKIQQAILDRQKILDHEHCQNRKQALNDINRSISSLTKKLENRAKNRTKAIQEYKQKLKKEGFYHPFEDGPMVRRLALEKLLSDPDYGPSRRGFVLLLQGLMVLLEMLPILMKVVFGKPTAYAAALQAAHRRALKRFRSDRSNTQR